MAKIDSVRRECEDIGTSLSHDDKSGVREALAAIHAKAMSVSEDASAASLSEDLVALRAKYKIDPAVAATYR